MRHYKVNNYQFGLRLLALRTQTGLTQATLAARLSVATRAIQRWESGAGSPSTEHLKKLIRIYVQEGTFTTGKEVEEAEDLWNSSQNPHAHRKPLFEKEWVRDVLFEQEHLIQAPDAGDLAQFKTKSTTQAITSRPQQVDYAPHPFYGRTAELEQLSHWIVGGHSRLLAIVGMGGVGKTALAGALMQHLAPSFEAATWQALHAAPLLEELLTNCLLELQEDRHEDATFDEEHALRRLLKVLQTRRCLLILDNAETLIQTGSYAGAYQTGYEGYARFLLLLGETPHRSCVVLTSRETPREVHYLEAKGSQVHTLYLAGLKPEESRALLCQEQIVGAQETLDALAERYVGNPLALRLVCGTIREVFGGESATFIAHGALLFGHIRELLAQQFERMAPLEQAILYWLALGRTRVSLEELLSNLIPSPSREMVVEIIDSLLRRRAWVEGDRGRAQFQLQPVIGEYVTDHLLRQICQEIEAGELTMLQRYALLQAQASDSVRKNQLRLILTPLLQQLLEALGKRGLQQQFHMLLARLRELGPRAPGYAASTILHLLAQLDSNLSEYDFSHLTLWQADLRLVDVRRCTFAYADLGRTRWLERFSTIQSIAFSPDGTWMVAGTGTPGEEGRMWRVADGSLAWTINTHRDWVTAVTFSRDGRLLALGSGDHSITLWDVQRRVCLHTLREHTDWIAAVAFSPDGRILASASSDRSIRLWDVEMGTCLTTFLGHSDAVWSVVFHPNGQMLASGSGDGSVRLWDVTTFRCFSTLQAHHKPIWAIAFHPDGQMLASGSGDCSVRLWNISSQQCIATLQQHTETVWTVAFSPDGQMLASGSGDTTIKLWDTTTRHCHTTLRGHGSLIRSVAFHPTRQLLASGGYDESIRFWDLDQGQNLLTLQGETHPVWSLSYSDVNGLLASSHGDRFVYLWDVRGGRLLQRLRGHTDWVTSVAFHPHSTLLASGSQDQTVRLWASTGQCIRVLSGHTSPVWACAFSADGLLLASGSSDQTIRLWSVETGQCLLVLEGHRGWVTSLAFHPDGKTLVSGSGDQTIRLWEIETGKCISVMHGHSSVVRSVTCSPDGRRLASGSGDTTIKLWEVSTMTCSVTLQGHSSQVYSVAFNEDGRFLISGSADQTVKRWQSHDGRCLQTFRGHTQSVQTVIFGYDEATIISGGQDEAIRCWSIPTGECFETLKADLPYAQLDITGAEGLTETHRAMLLSLGAVDQASKETVPELPPSL
ncbi:hypothetical protein KDA_46370 [Dictyobacter alpinus]|uniref:HTH cro/C1-type domain-containing protein n=1 Tax=Dictyobacter alpinus TaxID=2014873 RepID=A0A402BCP1_9CHLR|nr:NB-ARC domain-containing protein [Dictyobacter alpinus]GCE29153.1 hypothetical protein KDA_46370 [Dictyobacter alpinus]